MGLYNKALAILVLYTSIHVLVGQVVAEDASEGAAETEENPAFFLQDPTDGMCLAGDVFKRCAIDTLWYATGADGEYQIHKRPVEEGDDDLCLQRVHCHAPTSETRVGKCDHCGAKKWNIAGDSERGYVLTEDEGKNCLHRRQLEGSDDKKELDTAAEVVHCDEGGFTMLNLQFAVGEDLTALASPEARLITACSDGDKKKVKKFLDDGVDINSRDWDQLTPLIAASTSGHLDIVKLLVGQGADVNAKDKDGITALMEASIMDRKEIVKFLLEKDADVNAQTISEVTPLWLAAGEGRKDIVPLLIAKGADVNTKRSDGITAVMAASVGKHVDVVKMLIDKAADINAKDRDGLTALMNGAEVGSEEVVAALVAAGADANALSETGFTPLIVAAAGGHTGVLKQLLAAGGSVNADHPEGVTALMYAAAGAHLEALELLVEQGADVNRLHAHGGSALMEACTSGSVEVVKALVAKGADTKLMDKDGVTLLMSAAAQGHAEVVDALMDLGAGEPNAKATSGGTALMFAAAGGHTEAVTKLLDHKADPNIAVEATAEYIEQVAKQIEEGSKDGEEVEPHKDGVTALQLAAQGGHLEAVKALVEAGADVKAADDESWTALLNAVKGNFGGVATYLVENGADPNDVFIDSEGKNHNLLMDSIVVKNTEFAELLLEKGADPTHVDDNGVTTLTQAAHRGHLDLVKKLIADGRVSVSTASEEGITALIAAATEGHHEILEALLAAGASASDKDKEGTTALMAAAVRGHKETLEALIKAGADVNAQNSDGHTALMFAYNGKSQVASLFDRYAEYLTKADEEGGSQIIQEALDTHDQIIKLLLDSGADGSIKDNEGNTADSYDYKPVDPDDVEKARKILDEL
eukprot:CAMPEP_0113943834 /NCGR_PEP_ID=MMETSP1339-20121228/28444_1 /TAXON_ID=94617 /ORGANISM="Fibrocapsa japonica" /LENGTH=870 /DNA_ID=CAMNT_0000948801 /DNA_START=93 /DNA_END=2705 /DNA_ORIENTATION=+ /assembly_acc=CAM_ASM_000762